jgi:hypothetical protein
MSSAISAETLPSLIQDLPESLYEESVMSDEVRELNSSPQAVIVTNVDVAIQCNKLGETLKEPEGILSLDRFRGNPDLIQFYTGFDNYKHLKFFFGILGPAANELNYQCLQVNLAPLDQLFLTMIRLRRAKEITELSFLFGVSRQTVGRIFCTWINFMYCQLKELNIWPSRRSVQQHMPQHFGKLFPSTRVILDATECPIIKSKNVASQSATFSHYKNKNTVKTVIGCTPRGAISFISETYGGSASDRQIIERSQLCTSSGIFEAGDSIMADRGLMVQDLFATKHVTVNTPHLLKGKSQLEREELIADRCIASKRIHIERIIGLAKTYKILDRKLSCYEINMAEKIIFICFAIQNFRKCIVGPLA